jgi:putative tryptophan/tyrosine transport system substrate-binding protein
MSYGTDLTAAYHQIGIYAARMLKDEKIADLPIVQPIKFELIINPKSATAVPLGLKCRPLLLAQATEVIE